MKEAAAFETESVPGKLQRELRQGKPFGSLQEEAFLSLQRTASLLMRGLSRQLRHYKVTPSQYNVLRILRGASPDALTCSAIGDRLVTPGPDVTRLVDRLVQRGLVERNRDTHDRRVVQVSITERGREILAALDELVDAQIGKLLAPLGERDLGRLVSLLAALR